MIASSWAVGLALLVGSIRAFQLWRSLPRVDVVNVAVVSTLAEGRGQDIGRLLAIGSSPYLGLARAMAGGFEKLPRADQRTARRALEREAMVALAAANRALRRFAWLDGFALVAIAFAGITAATERRATPVLALELFVATLLWLANVRAARSIATRMYAGAMALVDDLVDGRDALQAARAKAQQAAADNER